MILASSSVVLVSVLKSLVLSWSRVLGLGLKLCGFDLGLQILVLFTSPSL